MFAAKDLFATRSGYNIAKSLRFRSSASAYLNRTPGSASNRKTWTFSAWLKKGDPSTADDRYLFSATNGTTTVAGLFFNGGGDTLRIAHYDGTTNVFNLVTNAVFRDYSAWYHVVLAFDTTQSTDTNRVKLYINGVQQTFGTTVWPTLNYDSYINLNNTHKIGLSAASATAGKFDGYLSEVNFIDGQALDPTYFGQTDTATGVWMPKAYTGTYGTNGFYLKFDDVGSTTTTNVGYGKDSSGNANRWQTNNLSSTAGVTYDSMVDTPTNYDNGGNGAGNYCVLNPLRYFSNAPSNANLTCTYGNASPTINTGSFGALTGKWYWEVYVTASVGSELIGILPTTLFPLSVNGTDLMGYYPNGQKYRSGTGATYGASFTTGDTIGVALDCDNGTLSFYKNNASQGTAYSSLTGTIWQPMTQNGGPGGSVDFNFGQRPFTYTPPTGFKALCTQNLPTPTIGATSSTLANKYFDVLTWTGNSSSTGTTRNQTGLSFQPDFVWIKNRSNAYYHNLYDAVRGAGSTKNLVSNTTDAEGASNSAGLYGYLSSFNSDGFQTTNGTDASFPGIWVNQNTQTFVSWNWKANGSGSTGSGSGLTSITNSANATAGFSVTTYTGNGTAGAYFNHGLGSATPKMVIVKQRTASSTTNWAVWHTALAATEYMLLNTTAAKATGTTYWNSTAPDSTKVTLGTSADVNTNTGTYVAYCFAEVAGYSKFGSLTGNASADGSFVYLGFKPKLILIKCSSTTGNWYLFDTARNTYNVLGEQLYPNLSNAGSTVTTLDVLSNGFKLRLTGDPNAAQTYIYGAWAETPFNYSRAF